MSDQQEKKLIIDEDWKQEAQREKEILAEQEKEDQRKKQASGHGPLPEADFLSLVNLLATQAFYALGVIRAQGQEHEDIEPDLEMAQYNIDILTMVQNKTRGNLDDQEKKAIEDVLYNLRMIYVQVSNGIKIQ